MKTPYTPFCTRLSGSAKETELRLRSIFQWKKKRPPVIVFLAVVVVIALCFALVGVSSTPHSGTIAQLYPEYFAENSVREVWYEDKEAYVPGALEPGSENFAVAMEYFGAMKLRALTGQSKYIGEFDLRMGAFYLEGEQDVPLKVEFYPDGYVVISKGRGQTEDNEGARVYRVQSFDKEVFLNYWEAPEEQPVDVQSQHQPTGSVYELFGEDGITLTLHLADEGGHNSYEITQFSYAERFAVLMGGYEWTRLEMPLTEPSQFHLTAKSLDGERTMTFWSGSTAMIQYNGTETTTYWAGTPVSPEATSIAEDIRGIYNMLDAASSRVMFRGEGTAQEAANAFVHSEYEKHLMSLAPGNPYAVSEYAVVKWLVREISGDGLAVTGDFEYAFVPVVPDAVEIWAGNTSQGTGEYAGMLTAYRQFTLQKQADGYWHCIDLGTGGARLPERDDTGSVLNLLDALLADGEADLWAFLFPGTGPISASMDGLHDAVRNVFAQYEWTLETGSEPERSMGHDDFTMYLVSDSMRIAENTDSNWVNFARPGQENVNYSYNGEPGSVSRALLELWDGPAFRLARVYIPVEGQDNETLMKTYEAKFREQYLTSGAITGYELRELSPITVPDGADSGPFFLFSFAVKPADPAHPCWLHFPAGEDGWVEFSFEVNLSMGGYEDDSVWMCGYWQWP